MKTSFKLAVLVLPALLILNSQLSTAFAQGTAFTYQGRLNDGGSPASGSYDLTFTLFGVNAGGVAVAGPVTNSAVDVTNGLFTTLVDFGPDVFTGGSNWLEIAVSTNGANSFTTLTPRQRITPTPYAITAENLNGSVSAGQVSGVLPLAQLPAVLVTNNAANVTLSGNLFGNFGGNFFGNGAGLSALNPTNLTAGTAAINITGNAATATTGASVTTFTNPLTDAQLSANIPRLNGTNVFTGTNTFSSAVIATNPANQIYGTFIGDGSGLTNLGVSQLGGTNPVADVQLSGNIPRLNGTNVFTGTNIFYNTVIATNPANQFAGTFAGNGGGLTNVSVSQLGGVLPLADLPPGVVTNGASNVTLSGTFSGDGSGLTNLNGGAIAAGSISSSALASNSISAGQLASGAAAANLGASGQSGVTHGSMILSSYVNDANLLNAGYVKLGRVEMADSWQQLETNVVPSARSSHTAVWTGNEMIIWGGYFNNNMDHKCPVSS